MLRESREAPSGVYGSVVIQVAEKNSFVRASIVEGRLA
jgi:hypothetical protein